MDDKLRSTDRRAIDDKFVVEWWRYTGNVKRRNRKVMLGSWKQQIWNVTGVFSGYVDGLTHSHEYSEYIIQLSIDIQFGSSCGAAEIICNNYWKKVRWLSCNDGWQTVTLFSQYLVVIRIAVSSQRQLLFRKTNVSTIISYSLTWGSSSDARSACTNAINYAADFPPCQVHATVVSTFSSPCLPAFNIN